MDAKEEANKKANEEVVNKKDLRAFDKNKKKKAKVGRKEKPLSEVAADSVPLPSTENLVANSWLKDDESGKERDYTYSELLKRLYDRISSRTDQEGPLGQRRHIDPPEVGRVGTKRVAWINFYNNCKSVNRPPNHVLEFVLSELGTTGSIAADNKLIIRGRFQPKQLENLLKKYIAEYVTCKTCKSPDTTLKKENRLLFKVCSSCGSSTSVSPVQSGFNKQAQGKKDKQE